ncbi:hypothetical protein CEQ15_05400 [Chryseobacterium indologenes]|uniref:hypothetical protein n=1 Tax=Chryseobacterium indologenes TaxID=253 RepID=UPI000B515865|nr:hypothetical protein [Chryseobacterium indologenes]ASE60975.1 hypothetical protein CEQ15_05400 [Chryseobacterium indologenes]
MKRLFVLFLCVCSFSCIGQTIKQIDLLTSGIGQTFSELEKKLSLKSSGKKKRFGLESRTYDFKDFWILVSEVEEGKIGKISYFINVDKNLSERWYQLASDMNNNSSYIFQKSFIADPEDKLTTEDLDFKSLVSLLRSSRGTDEFIFEVTYKKDNTITRLSHSPVSISIETKIEEIK